MMVETVLKHEPALWISEYRTFVLHVRVPGEAIPRQATVAGKDIDRIISVRVKWFRLLNHETGWNLSEVAVHGHVEGDNARLTRSIEVFLASGTTREDTNNGPRYRKIDHPRPQWLQELIDQTKPDKPIPPR